MCRTIKSFVPYRQLIPQNMAPNAAVFDRRNGINSPEVPEGNAELPCREARRTFDGNSLCDSSSLSAVQHD